MLDRFVLVALVGIVDPPRPEAHVTEVAVTTSSCDPLTLAASPADTFCPSKSASPSTPYT